MEKARSARRTAMALCAIICIGCANREALKPSLERFKNVETDDHFEITTQGYTYRGRVDYERIAKQAARHFNAYVKTGSDSSRSMFLVSLGMLVDGKNIYKQGANLEYLMKDPAYGKIRAGFRKRRPKGSVDEFLDAIERVKKEGDSFRTRLAYGKGFVDAVLEYSKEKDQ